MKRAAMLCLIALIAACAGENKSEPLTWHPLEKTADLDPAPNVLEVEIVARQAEIEILPGVKSAAWTYNGMFPGPLLEAKVGDTLKVHFKNELPQATTIHWHGLRLPASMDGAMVMMDPVPPGGTFEYEFVLRDAGYYWYHPHMYTDEAMERGLYGAIVVREAVEPKVDVERLLVLDDMKINPSTGAIDVPGNMMEAMDGFEGNRIVVNGRADAVLPIRAGEIQRWRLVNASSARYLDLRLDGHSFRVIGTDGGLLPEPYDTDKVVMTPGERYDLIVQGTGGRGTEVPLIAREYYRGQMHGGDSTREVFKLRYSGASALEGKVVPETAREIEILPTAGVYDRLVALTQTDGFGFNDEHYPAVTPLHVEPQLLEIWTLRNMTDWDHPFHLHGNFFQVLDANGVMAPRHGWKDTMNVRRRTTVRIAVRHDNPGVWMYHCHILGHGENGMAGELHVGEHAE